MVFIACLFIIIFIITRINVRLSQSQAQSMELTEHEEPRPLNNDHVTLRCRHTLYMAPPPLDEFVTD